MLHKYPFQYFGYSGRGGSSIESNEYIPHRPWATMPDPPGCGINVPAFVSAKISWCVSAGGKLRSFTVTFRAKVLREINLIDS